MSLKVPGVHNIKIIFGLFTIALICLIYIGNYRGINITISLEITLIFFLFLILVADKISKNNGPTSDEREPSLNEGRRKFLYYMISGYLSLLTIANLAYMQVKSSNLVYNGNFEEGFEGWDLTNSNVFSWKILYPKDTGESPILEVQTNLAYKGILLWSWIASNQIKVNYGKRYTITTHMSTENVLQSSIVIQPYDAYGRQLSYQLAQIPSGINGTSPMKRYEGEIEIPPEVSYIVIFLNAGLSNQFGKIGKTYFADIEVRELHPLL